MKKIYTFLSYLLVAVLASTGTMYLCNREWKPEYSKLEQLSDLIDERFIGESDRTDYEDAAAAAMVAPPV